MADTHDIKKELKTYKIIYIGLLVFSIITVAASYIPTSVAAGIIIALIIASFKASLVAGYFMHLKAEKKLVVGVLLMTVVLFLGMILLIYASQYNVYEGLKYVS